MTTGFPLPGIAVNPGYPATSVSITSTSGANAPIFSDQYGVHAVSLPVVISMPTTYYVAGEGPWTVNGQVVVLEDNQVATVNLPRPTAARLGGTTNRAASLPYYNVKDFGALGDGVTDDTAAINATLAASANLQSEVIFPPGTYLVNPPIPGTSAKTLVPPITINGLRIRGEGIGASVIKSTYTGFGTILANQGNDQGWLIEGIEIQGPGGNVVTGLSIGAGGILQAGFGNGVIGIGAYFMAASIIRDCKVSGCSAGVEDISGNFNDWEVWTPNNRNVGIALLGGGGGGHVVRGLSQVQNGSGNAANGEVVTNVLLACNTTNDGGPQTCEIESHYVDEIALNTVAGGSCIYIVQASGIVISTATVYAPGKKQGANAPFYGIRIGPGASRTKVVGTRIQPYTVDTVRVPDHTILIEAGATDTVLQDVSTNPNLANGGGDILDSGTRTIFRNVRLNDGPSITSIATKTGVPVDGDYNVAPPVGTQVLDTTDGKIYYRTAAATWKAATLT